MSYLFLIIAICLIGTNTTLAAMPSIQAVQHQALRSAGLGGSRPENWQKRAAWQAALPQLRVTVQQDLDEQLRLTNRDNISLAGGNVTIGPNEQDFLQDFDSELRFQVSATWDLDRLVFNRDQLLISQERRRRNEEKWRLLDRVNTLYYEYQQAERVGGSTQKRLMAERAAQLDALTDGWFSGQLERRVSK